MTERIRKLATILILLAAAGCSTPTAPQAAAVPPYLVMPLATANIHTVASLRYEDQAGHPISEQAFAAQYGKTGRFILRKAGGDDFPGVTLRVTSTGAVHEPGAFDTAAQGHPRIPARDAMVDLNSCARPVYPKSELRQLHTGIVTMSFLVSVDGAVKKAEIVTSSGYPALDQAAMSALVLCRFRPATADGVPQERWSPVQYVWRIQ